MPVPNSIHDYLRMFAGELGEQILQSFPALHNAHDPVSPRLEGKGDKIRFVPVHPTAQRLIAEFLEMAKHGGALDGPLFPPVKNNRTGTLDKHLEPGSVYRNIVRKYGRETGINAEVNGLCVHSLTK